MQEKLGTLLWGNGGIARLFVEFSDVGFAVWGWE